MSVRSVRSLSWLLVVALFGAACEDAPTTPTAEPEPELAPEVALEQMADEAVRAGDAERRDVLLQGAAALRRGIRPSEIEVKIQNETFLYKALVIGIVRVRRDDQRVLVRTLIAWTGERRPTAILHVTSRSDLALFGPPPGNSGEAGGDGGPGRARGWWADLVNRERWVATAGSADIELVETGGACPLPTTADGGLNCELARWDLRINGNFEQAGSEGGGPHKAIHTNADGVNGAVLSPAD